MLDKNLFFEGGEVPSIGFQETTKASPPFWVPLISRQAQLKVYSTALPKVSPSLAPGARAGPPEPSVAISRGPAGILFTKDPNGCLLLGSGCFRGCPKGQQSSTRHGLLPYYSSTVATGPLDFRVPSQSKFCCINGDPHDPGGVLPTKGACPSSCPSVDTRSIVFGAGPHICSSDSLLWQSGALKRIRFQSLATQGVVGLWA